MWRITLLLGCIAFPTTLFAQSVSDSNWTQWRGPDGNGKALASARPPIKWDLQTNIRWTTKLPGEGSSTPIVLNNQIFLLSAEATNRKSEKPSQPDEASKTTPPNVYYRFWVTSIDRKSGDIQWQKLATEQVPHGGKHNTHTYAAGSPTTDGEHLFVSFGSQGIFCFTLAGDLVWHS